jgi:hypothetical protein
MTTPPPPPPDPTPHAPFTSLPFNSSVVCFLWVNPSVVCFLWVVWARDGCENGG